MGERGREFGTVTGRKRRCGWFDVVMVRQAGLTAGITGMALTKLDVLMGLMLNIVSAMIVAAKGWIISPPMPLIRKKCSPIYEEMPGWSETTYGARSGRIASKCGEIYPPC